MHKFFIPILTLALIISACVPTPPVTAVPSEPASSALTLNMLRNGTYVAPSTSRTITLTDGAYLSGSDPSAADFLQATMSEQVVFGDLDGDGWEDAVILLAENTGGTGVFVSLLVIRNDHGTPLQVASVYIDDRPIVNSLSIVSGEILLDMIIHAPEDPMCCPSLTSGQGYRLYGGNTLVLTHLQTQPSGGSLRAINITSPADLQEVAYPFVLNGAVTVGPFENTLAYNVYAPDNLLVTAGSVMTDSPDMGLPGNFTLTLDLSSAGLMGLVRIEFVEYSMADGSVMTLDSVLVDVH